MPNCKTEQKDLFPCCHLNRCFIRNGDDNAMAICISLVHHLNVARVRVQINVKIVINLFQLIDGVLYTANTSSKKLDSPPSCCVGDEEHAAHIFGNSRATEDRLWLCTYLEAHAVQIKNFCALNR